DVVIVAAPEALLERASAVGGLPERAVRDEHFVLVGRRHADVDVVARTANQRALPVHDAPAGAAVIRSPHRALILRLNQRVDATGIGWRHGHVDLAERTPRQSRSL